VVQAVKSEKVCSEELVRADRAERASDVLTLLSGRRGKTNLLRGFAL